MSVTFSIFGGVPNNSRQDAKTQRTAKITTQISFALLGVFAPWRETVRLFTDFKPWVRIEDRGAQARHEKKDVNYDDRSGRLVEKKGLKKSKSEDPDEL